MLISNNHPDEYQDYTQFCDFVRKQLGDIPVLDEGRFISPKIVYYWAAWRVETEIHSFSTIERWNNLIKARAYWVRYVQQVH